MPVIVRFYGIIIKIFLKESEHNPPHFHAIYNEHNALINIITLEVIESDLPSKALSLVLEWAKIYQQDLEDIWNTQNFKKLPPLE